MAIHTPITPPCHSEAAPSFRPSPVTVLFGDMVRNLSAYIEAERDLEHCSGWDLACDAWIRDAERARNRVLDSLAQLDAMPPERHEDQPLKRLGKMAQLLIESDTPKTFRDTLALQAYFPALFRCADTSPIGRRTNQMIAAFQPHLNALSALPDFMETIEADHAEINRDDPDYLMAPAA